MTMTVEAPAEEAISNALRGVIDTELGDNVVDLGMVQRIDIDTENKVAITVALSTAGCPLRAQLMNDVKTRVGTLPGVQAVRVHFGEMTAEQKRDVMSRARWKAQENAPETTILATCRIVAIASGKGVVGKSSVTVNLAALPGTADVQMGLARMLPRTDVIIVTTPALAAQQVATRAADMARKGYLRVAGVIANMSATIGPDGSRHAVFGEGGGERLAQQLGVALLGSIPLDPAVSAGGDLGDPAALVEPDTQAATPFALPADRIVTDTIPPVELAVCSIRQVLTEPGADLESAFDRLNQVESHEPTPATAANNHQRRSRSNLS